ncbi:SEC7 domain-containing protein [Durusdinium trenchii]|uniref:SEC7 domain-containing protein n=1 Tax=Durusdinium trenchii TaxID=1381693 RepID=A0ABP0H4K7_9DINO
MRSFFANAIRMAKLEADPVQRVIEAFAEALVADAAFLSCFEASMLPEAERQTYRTPDEVLFGLAYTTLMLNTDMHNKQVAQKMWDNKKFAGRPDAWIHRLCLLPPLIGKDCPVWF